MTHDNNDAVAALAKIANARQAVRTAEEHLRAVCAGRRHAIAKHREALANLAKLLDGETADMPLFDAPPPPVPAKSKRSRKAKSEPERADASIAPARPRKPGEAAFDVYDSMEFMGSVFARDAYHARARAAVEFAVISPCNLRVELADGQPSAAERKVERAAARAANEAKRQRAIDRWAAREQASQSEGATP